MFAHPYMRARHGVWSSKFAHGHLDILDVLKFHGVSERQLRRLRAKARKGRRSDRLRCGARRRDGGECEMRAVCDRMTGGPLHGGPLQAAWWSQHGPANDCGTSGDRGLKSDTSAAGRSTNGLTE
jgi:hypothetical protein